MKILEEKIIYVSTKLRTMTGKINCLCGKFDNCDCSFNGKYQTVDSKEQPVLVTKYEENGRTFTKYDRLNDSLKNISIHPDECLR